MSIPKEPRQLMINLMYLVLLAMLALNVSAEIMNAFMTMDEGIQESSQVMESSNKQVLGAIETQAEAYRQFRPFYDKSTELRTITSTFNDWVGTLRDSLVILAGGYDAKVINRPKKYKDKNIPTRFLVKEKRGDSLEKRIETTRLAMLDLIENEEDRLRLSSKIPLSVSKIPATSDKPSWAAFTFEQMPVAAVLPVFSKIQNDAKVAESAILNYFLEKAKGEDIILDKYQVVAAPEQSYVIRGEQFKGEVFLGAYSSTSNNLSIRIGGQSFPVRNGKASFSIPTSSIGKKNYKVDISVRDPVTKQVKTYSDTYAYEVGERSVTVSAEKMNVLYMGVENPIAISAAGISTNDLRVKANGIRLSKQSNGKYIARPERVGKAKITISGGGLPATDFEYRVKKIPNPVVYLGRKTSGSIRAAEMRAQEGIVPILEGFDFDARCEVKGFELVRQPKKGDVVDALNRGGRFSGRAKQYIDQAKAGDKYYFDKIKVQCPGDTSPRTLNSMIFQIR